MSPRDKVNPLASRGLRGPRSSARELITRTGGGVRSARGRWRGLWNECGGGDGGVVLSSEDRWLIAFLEFLF